jgi:hypothetical protein
MDTVNGIELTEPGAPSHILRDLTEYATLASITSFDVPQAHGQRAKPFTAVRGQASMCMPKLVVLFLQIKLNYERPPSSKFGKDLPLWKTATSCFLNIVKEIGPRLMFLARV